VSDSTGTSDIVHCALHMQGKGVVTRGQTGSAAVGTLANGQLYALLLSPDADSRDHSDDDAAALGSTSSSSSSGSAASAAAVHVLPDRSSSSSSSKRSARGDKGLPTPPRTASQTLLPPGESAHGLYHHHHHHHHHHSVRDSSRLSFGHSSSSSSAGAHSSGEDGSSSGVSSSGSAAVVSVPGRASSPAAAAAAHKCFVGHPEFPRCLEGVHTLLGADVDMRSVGGLAGEWQSASPWGHNTGSSSGSRPGLRISDSSYNSRLPPLPAHDSLLEEHAGGRWLRSVLGLGPSSGSSSAKQQRRQRLLYAWLYNFWVLLSVGIAAVAVLVALDGRRAARLFRLIGLIEHSRDALSGTTSSSSTHNADVLARAAAAAASGAEGANHSSVSNGSAAVVTVPERDEHGMLRVGCLTVSDTVLGYGSSGTVVYRGLLEGRPVAVKRMLKDFHARADREIALLIESDGHPHVVRYFVREEAGEFVYLALQLCQLSLHSGVAQVQSAVAAAAATAASSADSGDGTAAGSSSSSGSGAAGGLSAPHELRDALLQIARGVQHLHSLRIVHRDLKVTLLTLTVSTLQHS
jgi:Protein kinase domain